MYSLLFETQTKDTRDRLGNSHSHLKNKNITHCGNKYLIVFKRQFKNQGRHSLFLGNVFVRNNIYANIHH